jgi:hypothetical protein
VGWGATLKYSYVLLCAFSSEKTKCFMLPHYKKSHVVIPAKAEALYNSEAGQSMLRAGDGFRPSPE